MSKKAIILVGHGSSMPYNKEVMIELAKKLEKRRKWDVVSYSFLERDTPSLSEAIEAVCEDRLVETIVIAPVFISSGAHIKNDIPKILGLNNKEKTIEKDVGGEIRKFYYSTPIGADDKLVDVIHFNAINTLESHR